MRGRKRCDRIGKATGICRVAFALDVVCGAAPRLEIDANGDVTALEFGNLHSVSLHLRKLRVL